MRYNKIQNIELIDEGIIPRENFDMEDMVVGLNRTKYPRDRVTLYQGSGEPGVNAKIHRFVYNVIRERSTNNLYKHILSNENRN